jgi:hypothetical protein
VFVQKPKEPAEERFCKRAEAVVVFAPLVVTASITLEDWAASTRIRGSAIYPHCTELFTESAGIRGCDRACIEGMQLMPP